MKMKEKNLNSYLAICLLMLFLQFVTNHATTLGYTGTLNSFTTPQGAVTMTVEMAGARGGNYGASLGGKGARVKATFAVFGGTPFYFNIGSHTGYNGGGAGRNGNNGMAGGGATDIRTTPNINDRMMVAGGGGGSMNLDNTNGGAGGFNGEDAIAGPGGWLAPTGGTQTAGGAKGCDTSQVNNCGSPGTFGSGGASNPSYGGGGGGGYYGGGGGRQAGAGGSSFVANTGYDVSYETGINSDNGYIILTFGYPPTLSPTAVPSVIPTVTPTLIPTVIPTTRPTTPTSVPSGQPSRQPSGQPTNQPSRQPSSQPSGQPTSQPSGQPTGQPTNQPSRQPSGRPSATPSCTPTTQPSGQPSSQPMANPSSTPTGQPSTQPSGQPTGQPTQGPIGQPSSRPTVQPSNQPSSKPSGQPKGLPTVSPSSQPSSQPSGQPTGQPSASPTTQPTVAPSAQPSGQPSTQPSSQPVADPTGTPSNQPTSQPSSQPSSSPSVCPSSQPSSYPSTQPSGIPSTQPTVQPIATPTAQPSLQPNARPTAQPSGIPTAQPSGQPTSRPSMGPSSQPSSQPSRQPSTHPSSQPLSCPSVQPSSEPSFQPNGVPSTQPTAVPTMQPTSTPTIQPTVKPTDQPTSTPSVHPSVQPSSQPSNQPSDAPSAQPTTSPSTQPTCCPSVQPTANPSSQPSSMPSRKPSCEPSSQPSSQPTGVPSRQPSGTPSSQPTSIPSSQPSAKPTNQPTVQPSGVPSSKPTLQPSVTPSSQPSSTPSSQPTIQPSGHPSAMPSAQPSGWPSAQPTTYPTNQPSSHPSSQPTNQPTAIPSQQPSARPSSLPSSQPSSQPSGQPSGQPTASFTVYYPPTAYRSEFQISLPYLFVNQVEADPMKDIYLSLPDQGTAYLMLDPGVYSSQSISRRNTVETVSLIYVGSAVSFDFSGRSVANAGDVNGDGYDDLIIGVPFMSRVYVLFGTRYGFITMTDGFTVFGTHEFDQTGWSVSGAGDVNNDTLADIIIGAPASYDTGTVYVLYGGAEMLNGVEVRLSELTTAQGLVIRGAASQDAFGWSVSGAGDVNGDGYGDVIAGALRPSTFNSGAAYIVFGKAGFRNKVEFSTSELDQVDELKVIQGAPWSWFSYSLSSAGDINDDKCSDIIVGGLHTSYVVYGGRTAGGLPLSVADITAEHGFQITGGGVLVKGLSDINSNKHNDLLIVGNVDLSHSAGLTLIYPCNLSVLSVQPTVTPTWRPSQLPSKQPTYRPTVQPIVMPTVLPTQHPSTLPSLRPTYVPSGPSATPTTAIPTVSQHPSQASRAPTLSSTGGTSTYQPSSSFSVPTLKPVQVIVRPTIAPNMMTTYQPSHLPTRFNTIRTVYVADNITNKYTLHNNTLSMIHYIVNTTQPVTIKGPTVQCIFTLIPARDGQLTLFGFSNTTDVLDLQAFTYITSYQHLLSYVTQAGGNIVFNFRNSQVLTLIDTAIAELVEGSFMFYGGVPIDSDNEQRSTETKGTPYITIVSSALSGAFIAYLAYKLWLFWVDYRKKNTHQVESTTHTERFCEIVLPNQGMCTHNDQLSSSYSSSGSGSHETKTNDSDTTTSISSKEFDNELICDLNSSNSDSIDDWSKSSGFFASASQHSHISLSLRSPKTRNTKGTTMRSRFYSEEYIPSPTASVLHALSISDYEDSVTCNGLVSASTSPFTTGAKRSLMGQSESGTAKIFDISIKRLNDNNQIGNMSDCDNTVESLLDTDDCDSVSNHSVLNSEVSDFRSLSYVEGGDSSDDSNIDSSGSDCMASRSAISDVDDVDDHSMLGSMASQSTCASSAHSKSCMTDNTVAEYNSNISVVPSSFQVSLSESDLDSSVH